jgi:hypothetical protein
MQTVPPSLTPVQTVLIQDSNVSAPLFRSYVRLYASAWQRAYECTGPLDLDAEIAPLLDLPPSLARLHLRRLRSAGLIDWKRDARRRYVIHFPHSNGSSKANPACQGAEPQTWPAQTVPTQAALTQLSSGPPADQDLYATVMRCLARAGVWKEAAQRTAGIITANQLRGDPSLPDLGDVLGWIAYCFAERSLHNIGQPAVVLVARLSANQPCPRQQRPPRICARCGLSEGFCACAEPDYSYPESFLERALRPRLCARAETLWGLCPICHALSCRCAPDEPERCT